MTVGSLGLCARKGVAVVSKKVTSLLLAFVLTVALVPHVAWADSGESVPATAAQADQNLSSSGGDSSAVEAGEAAEVSGGSSSTESRQANDGQDDFGYSDAAEETQAASGLSGTMAFDSSGADVDRASGVAVQDASPLLSASAMAVDEDSYVVIQDTQDEDSSYDRVTGAISAGTELWANVYDSYSDDVIDHDEAWTYQWMSCPTKSSNVVDYVAIDGQTSQNLAVTNSLADQIAGSYLIVKVSADGRDYYGPATWSGFSSSNIPGPVLGAGQARLSSVSLDKASPHVGDTITATAYAGYGVPVTSEVEVTYTWSASTSRYGTFTEISSGQSPSCVIGEDQKNHYIKVEASAGFNAVSSMTSDAVLAEGAVQLSGVELVKPATTELGTTLEAKAYTGSSYSPTYVADGVTYTWKYAETTSPSYSTAWTTIAGATGATFTVSDPFYVGKCLSVSANAGANTVDFGYPYGYGPFKLVGAVDIYSASLNTYAVAVGDTITAQAKEKGSTGSIDSSKLTYQWQVSTTSKTSAFSDIPAATSSSLTLDSSYQGSYVRCLIKAKVGSSSYSTTATNAVAPAGSINVTSVSLDKSGKVTEGDVVVATAKASSQDVTSSDKVSWSWYWGDTASSVSTPIEGATGNSLEVTSALRGMYLKACANGGYSDVVSSAAGPVVPAGAVELYKVEVAGTAKIGSTLQATAFKSLASPVSANDVVSYQWQYSNTKSTSDSSFSDIVGATASTYTIGDTINGSASTGKYLRVKVTSDGSVVSTAKPYYSGTTQPVDPLGPITQAGEYALSSVGLTSSAQAMQAGATITPVAKVTSGYTETAAPSDAKLTYTWYVADSASGTYRVLDGGYDPLDGVLALSDALRGSYLKVTVSALANTVSSSTHQVVGPGEYDLLRVTLNPSSGDLLTGGSIDATVQAKSLASATYGDDVTSKVSFEWSVSDDRGGPFVPLAGASSSSLTVPREAAGKYLKVTASSGSSSVEAVFSAKVIDADSLEGVAKKLQQASFRANPVYGVDSTVNDLVKAKLVELGYTDVEVSTKAAEPRRSDSAATVGISTADDDTNGTITYLFMDPSEASSTFFSYTQLRQFDCVFELSRGGETFDFEPSYPVTIPWNDDLFEEFLEEESSSLAVGLSSGDIADAVTGDLTLPAKLTDSTGSSKTWSSVSWDTSDASLVQIDGSIYEGYTGKVTRAASDRVVTLTATISAGAISSSGGPDTTITKTFDVTVKGDPDKVAAEQAALAQKVGDGFTYDNLSYSDTGAAVGQSTLEGDIQLPTPKTIGVDGKYYAVTYAASSDSVVVNGYRGNAYRPLPGSEPSSVDITLTVTDKSNAEISASKTLSFNVSPLDAEDITAELALMQDAKAGYSAVLANGQSADAVTGDLRTFQKAYRDSQGNLAWAYDVTSADAAGAGIVTVDLPGYDPMGTAGWRVFKSSNAGVVSHESLHVTQPQYDTEVTVSSCLSSEKYARYAQLYADDPTWGATFSQLAAQSVTAAFTVAGTSGQVDPHVTATCSVIGADKSGNRETWAAASPYTLDNGATAADLSEAAFMQAGLVADFDPNGAYGWALNTITSPYDAGLTLGWDEPTGRYWQLFINGEAATVGASGYTLQAGDSVIWYYSGYGDLAPTDQLAVTCEVIGSDASGLSQTWASAGSYEMNEGSTAADLSEAMFDRTGLAHEADNGSYGWFLDTITSPYDAGQTLGYDASTGKYWQLFINGEAATVGAGSYALQAGDSVVWCYSAYGESLPDSAEVVVDPDAPRPSYDSSWPGYASGAAGGAVVVSPTPTQSTSLSWAYDYREDASATSGVSDPLIVNGDLYVVAGSTLRKIDSETGKVEATATIGTNIGYFCRPVYDDGVIIVPTDDGSLAAFTADALTCVWKTAALTDAGNALDYQALSSLTVGNGCVYAGFTVIGAGGVGKVGTLVCVSIADGSVLWQRTDGSVQSDSSAGYYWAGAAVSGADILIGDESGEMRLIDGMTGEVRARVSLGAACRSTVVAVPDGVSGSEDAYLVVTVDGTLHKIVREGDALFSGGSVRFASESSSTPAVADGMAFVCGVDAEGYGTLSVIDLSTLSVEHAVRGDKGKAQSAPLVSVQQSGTYVYFTCNGYPGGMYGYRLGDDAAYALYVPDAAYQQYCTASVVSDKSGNLYYTNDSGMLFALAGQQGSRVTFESNGGTSVASRFVALGATVSRPADPMRAGYSFSGWYSDEACTQPWDFDAPVSASLTLYAKWAAREVPGSGGEDAATSGNSLGTVPAAHVPIGQVAGSSASSEDVLKDSKGALLSRDVQGGASDGQGTGMSEAAVEQGMVNPWAVGGIGLGVVGLAVATAYVIRSRRRGGEAS